MRKQPTGVAGPVDLKRKGDPRPTPAIPKNLRPNVERSSHTTDSGVAGAKNYPGMYDYARALTAGKWGKGGKWK